MAISFNKEVITEAIKELLTENQAVPVRVKSKKPGDQGSVEVMTRDKMNALKRTGKVEVEPMEEDHHENPNDDSDMAKSQLYAIAKYSIELLQMIKDGQPLDAWVQAKITKAADYVDAVQHYMEGEEYLAANQGAPDDEPELTEAQVAELLRRTKDKTIHYLGQEYKVLDVDSAGTFTVEDPKTGKPFYINRKMYKDGNTEPKHYDTEEMELDIQPEDEINEGVSCCGRCGRVHESAKECKKPYISENSPRHCKNKK